MKPRLNILWLGLLLMSCAVNEPLSLPKAAGCRPYGVPTPAFQDPQFGTPAPAATPDLRPVCTPIYRTPTPNPNLPPTVTPMTSPAQAGPRVSTAPQNLTISPWNETVDQTAAAWDAGILAVTWHDDRQAYLTWSTAGGTGSRALAELLGSGALAAVAVSPAGRIYLVGGGQWTYSDNSGATWQPARPAPNGAVLRAVIQSDGFLRLFWLDGQQLQTAVQQSDGTWNGTLTLRDGVQSYDAIRAGDGLVVAAAGGQVTVWRFPEGIVTANLGDGLTHVHLTGRQGEVLLGLGRAVAGQGAAYVARSTDGGRSWPEFCQVQASAQPIGDVAAFPTAQGPYAVLWSWQPPAGEHVGAFPYIALSQLRFPSCSVSPEVGAVDGLAQAGGGPPGLLSLAARQTRFQLAADDRGIFLAFEGLSANGQADIYTVVLSPDRVFSGISLGGGQAGEEAP